MQAVQRNGRGGARRRTRRITVRAVAVAAIVVALAALAPAGRAEAAGVTTHAWMALEAIPLVQDADLKALLEANAGYVRAGGHFPDSGYWPGNTYGEEAHWQRFVDAYVDEILARDDCGDLTDPAGPCAQDIAHLMGTAAHGMGDEVWDWLFEPNSPDLDEYYLPPEFNGLADDGGQELQLDLVAVAVHGRDLSALPALPSKARMLSAFTRSGFTGNTEEQLDRGQEGLRLIQLAEGGFAPIHIDALRKAMPWMSNNVVTAPGGVQYAAKAIAAYWISIWGRLLGDQPVTKVGVTYPADGQRRIPAGGWVRSHQPGSAHGRGGARTRITASLSDALPFVPAVGEPRSVSQELPTGAMTLTDVASGELVPTMAGFPRVVPYGADSGGHTIDIQPAADLAPCSSYRVDVTDKLLDARGRAVQPMSWTFRTGADAEGRRCPDDPYTADEASVRVLHTDLVGRDATAAEIEAATYAFDRGAAFRSLVDGVLAGAERRAHLVDEAYRTALGRGADTTGSAHWASVLDAGTLTDVRAGLLGSPEAYRHAGGTPTAFVDALYPAALGRAADPAGRAYWAGRLTAGLNRSALARRLLTSAEGAGHEVAATYTALLDRQPEAAAATYWTGRLRAGSDPRRLVASVVRSAEYAGVARAG